MQLSEHAPLVHAVPQVRRYVLSFILEEPIRPDVPTQALRILFGSYCHKVRSILTGTQ